MKDQLALVGGKPIQDYFEYTEDGVKVNNHTYGELGEWQRLIAEAVLDTFLKGDAEGKGFTFPVLTINVTTKFFEHPLFTKVADLSNKFGTPFFQNFVNGVGGGQKLQPADVRSMCCRLSINLNEVAAHTGGLFGNGDQTGSLQVVTVSLPYVVRESDCDTKFFFSRLKDIMVMIKDEELWKRKIVTEYFDKGFFELAKQNFKRGFDTFFTSVGFIGLWEAVEMLTDNKNSFLNDDGLDLAEEILTFMKDTVQGFMEETGTLFNLEGVPAEGATYKLAKKALKKFPDIAHRGLKKAPYFTNSCHIPVEYQDRLDLIFKTQNRLQTIPTGGTVTHFTTGEEMTTSEIKTAIKTICNSQIPYFSINTVFSICPICGYIKGTHFTCPNKHTEEDMIRLKNLQPNYIKD